MLTFLFGVLIGFLIAVLFSIQITIMSIDEPIYSIKTDPDGGTTIIREGGL